MTRYFSIRSQLMKLVQVLGTGCAKCTKLKENAEQAVQELGIEASVEKIEDINVITGFGVMMTPALAIDGEVKAVGKVLSSEHIQKLLA
jgi:small redox-active disulfide protein 2